MIESIDSVKIPEFYKFLNSFCSLDETKGTQFKTTNITFSGIL